MALTVPGFFSVITGVNPGFDGSAYHCAMTDTMHSGGTSKLLGAVLAKEEESSKRRGAGTTCLAAASHAHGVDSTVSNGLGWDRGREEGEERKGIT